MNNNLINTQNHNLVNSAIITGSTGIGLLGGYGSFRLKTKNFNSYVTNQINILRQENDKILEGINQDCFNSIKDTPKYKGKIDNLTNEGKIFGKDFHLEDILNQIDLEDYKKNLKNFKETIAEGENEVLKAAKKKLFDTKLKYLSVGALTGLLLSSLGVLYKTKHNKKEAIGVNASES